MKFTRDKLCSIVKKWHVSPLKIFAGGLKKFKIKNWYLDENLQTLIEANVAVKTSDGYLLRLFCIGFTKKNPEQLKKTSYAKSSKIRQIRARMVEHMQKEVNLSFYC